MPDVQVRIFHPSGSPVLGGVDGLGHLFFVWGSVTGADEGMAADTVLEIIGESSTNPPPTFQQYPLTSWLGSWYPRIFAYAVYWYDTGTLPDGPFTIRVIAQTAAGGYLNEAQVTGLGATRTFLPIEE